MDCKDCNKNNKAVDHVPYISHEADMARQERTIKRLWIALIIVILLFAGSNLAWTIYEAQFKTVITQEVEQQADGSGNNQFVGGDMVGTTEG